MLLSVNLEMIRLCILHVCQRFFFKNNKYITINVHIYVF